MLDIPDELTAALLRSPQSELPRHLDKENRRTAFVPERMNDFLNKHSIHPLIDKAYPFEQAREA